jgi:hypothetical protein
MGTGARACSHFFWLNDFADVITPPYEKKIGVAVLVLGAAILAFVLYKIYGRSKAKANLGNIQK